jgi:hypothetical protein
LSSGITKKVDYVMIDDDESAGPAKKKKIADLQNKGEKVQIIDADEFIKMIEE